MTTPHSPTPGNISPTMHPEIEAAFAIQHAYWDSPEFAGAVDLAAQHVITKSLTIINAPENTLPLEARSFKTEEMLSRDGLGLKSDGIKGVPSSAIGDMLCYPNGAQAYHEKVSEGVLTALQHTEALPLKTRPWPVTVRIAWNSEGKAFFIHEVPIQTHPAIGDPSDFGSYTAHVDSGGWKHPDLEVDRQVMGYHHGSDQIGILEAMCEAADYDRKDPMFQTANKALRDIRSQEKKNPYYGKFGPVAYANRFQHPPLSAEIFDTANLERIEAEIAAKPRGLGRLATKFRKQTLQ